MDETIAQLKSRISELESNTAANLSIEDIPIPPSRMFSVN